jgi:hypothetical protein
MVNVVTGQFVKIVGLQANDDADDSGDDQASIVASAWPANYERQRALPAEADLGRSEAPTVRLSAPRPWSRTPMVVPNTPV